MESLHTDVRVQWVNIYADGVLTLTCCSLIGPFFISPASFIEARAIFLEWTLGALFPFPDRIV